jgi:hypothetical protein
MHPFWVTPVPACLPTAVVLHCLLCPQEMLVIKNLIIDYHVQLAIQFFIIKMG